MPIVPLPQFEADLAEHQAEQEALSKLKPPKTVVCRFGAMKLIGEFRFGLDVTPGCGSRLVVRTFRGTELGEMLTSTCPNAGCGKSITRKQMLDYIQASGGRDYPFYSQGRVLRVPLPEDMDGHSKCEQRAHGLKLDARRMADEAGLPIRVVQAEAILGGETLTFYYLSENARAGEDPRAHAGTLRQLLQREHRAQVELRPVGARDEARLTADYERCGQHCCCKNFLKVLKPVPMRTAKQQKATLDPLKISGRCGRLMCCLRYEDESYRELAARLPRRRSRVGTPEGPGEVMDTQILTQLVLVRLERDSRELAVPVEELSDPDEPLPPGDEPATPKPDTSSTAKPPASGGKKRRRKPADRDTRPAQADTPPPERDDQPSDGQSPKPAKGKRPQRKRRRRRKPGGGGGDGGGSGSGTDGGSGVG